MIQFLGNFFVSTDSALFLKGVYSKRKEFAPIWSKFFPFREDPLSSFLGE